MEKKYQKRDRYKINEPILYPPLKQAITNLDVDEDKYNDIGILSLRLMKQSEMSIYKLLYKPESQSDFISNHNTNKSVRSEYLKKLVEANLEYFPRELLEEKYKKRKDVSYDEKIKSVIQFKEYKKKIKKDQSKDSARKESIEANDTIKNNNGNKKTKTNDEVNIIEEEESHQDENEEQSFEEDDYLMNSEEEIGSNSEEANYSDGGD